MKTTLLIMAAGMGSRFGGNKQIARMGPHGEILLEYSIHDAMAAGFDKVVFVIKRSMEADFRALIGDLDRIKALGTDIIWLLPIHPIGVKGKKGSLGCPYANRDYRTVNPEYGTMEDFRALVEEIHTYNANT